jgi:hypothetical protein
LTNILWLQSYLFRGFACIGLGVALRVQPPAL